MTAIAGAISREGLTKANLGEYPATDTSGHPFFSFFPHRKGGNLLPLFFFGCPLSSSYPAGRFILLDTAGRRSTAFWQSGRRLPANPGKNNIGTLEATGAVSQIG